MQFQTTHWSVILAAGQESSPEAEEALDYLLNTYWRPLYGYVRRQGYSREDAQDLVQGFFCQFIERDRLHLADPERGRLRSFLLTALKHFLANAEEARKAAKRGGHYLILPLSAADKEVRLIETSPENLSPERAFDRHWALTVLEVVLKRLRQEQETAGHGDSFGLLKPYLEGDPPELRFAEIATRFNLSASGARMMVLRLRRRYRTLIMEEIARTLADPAMVKEELQALLAALRDKK